MQQMYLLKGKSVPLHVIDLADWRMVVSLFVYSSMSLINSTLKY